MTNAFGAVFGAVGNTIAGASAGIYLDNTTVNSGAIVWGSSVPNISNGIYTGSGSPNGVVAASTGSMYLNTSGAGGTTLYVKESGTGNSGWVGK